MPLLLLWPCMDRLPIGLPCTVAKQRPCWHVLRPTLSRSRRRGAAGAGGSGGRGAAGSGRQRPADAGAARCRAAHHGCLHAFRWHGPGDAEHSPAAAGQPEHCRGAEQQQRQQRWGWGQRWLDAERRCNRSDMHRLRGGGGGGGRWVRIANGAALRCMSSHLRCPLAAASQRAAPQRGFRAHPRPSSCPSPHLWQVPSCMCGGGGRGGAATKYSRKGSGWAAGKLAVREELRPAHQACSKLRQAAPPPPQAPTPEAC